MNINTVDLRERIAISKDFTPTERDFLLRTISPSAVGFVVWSNEHRGWWAHGGLGYAPGLDRAGRYTANGAIEICANALMTAPHIGMMSEIPVRVADLDSVFEGRHVPRVIFTGK